MAMVSMLAIYDLDYRFRITFGGENLWKRKKNRRSPHEVL